MAGTVQVVDGQGISVWLGGNPVLDRVDLAVRAGEVHGLVGPNGAGKTTLLSVLFGLVVPDEGTVRLFGRSRAEAGGRWLDGVGGFVEAPAFYPYLSARRNLAVLARLDDDAAAAGLIDPVLEEVGLGGVGRRRVRAYSLGMRQRLGLAAALLRRPRLLVLDEPTNGLDPGAVRDLRATVRRLAHDGVAVLLSSHDMAQVGELCDGVTVLDRGGVVFAGSLDRMREQAPCPSWRLTTSDDRAASALAGRLGDLEVTADEGGGLRVVTDRGPLDVFVVELGRAGVAVRALAEDVMPLEALFFGLTATGAAHAPPGREVAGADRG